MAEKTPLKIGDTTPIRTFEAGDYVATANGGVPAGGTTGQVLSKVDGTDHNVEWADAGSGGSGDISGSGAAGQNAVFTGTKTITSYDTFTYSQVGGFVTRASSFVFWRHIVNNSTPFGAQFVFQRSRGSYALPSAVTLGTQLGNFLWAGYDGTSYVNMTQITSSAGDIIPTLSWRYGIMDFYAIGDGGSLSSRLQFDGKGDFRMAKTLFIQGTSAASSTPINTSATLEIGGTTGGLLHSRLTTAQRDAISSPADGLMIYNTDTGKFQGRASGAWVDLH